MSFKAFVPLRDESLFKFTPPASLEVGGGYNHYDWRK